MLPSKHNRHTQQTGFTTRIPQRARTLRIALAGNKTSFTATAKGKFNDDAVLDTWTIDQNKNLQYTVNYIISE